MKTRPSTEYALLGAMMSRPKHGYEILRFLDSSLGSTWHIGTSQLYALLKRLEQKGLLSSTMKAQETRPSKRIFAPTGAGRKAFIEWLHTPSEHVRDLRIEFLAKVFFFHRFSLDGADRLIEAQIQTLKQIRERMRKRRKGEKDPYTGLVLGFKITTLEAWIGWLLREAKPFVSAHMDGKPLTRDETKSTPL
jgi:PadR family transcriptional regulator AphA